jgi:GT2 family glycosyltransferase
MVKLCIGVPNGGTIKTQTVANLYALTQLHIPIYFSMPVSGYSTYNRNQTVEKAKEIGASHIMFIDGDMLFTPDAVEKLIAHDKDIIAANYHQRDKEPPQSTVFMYQDKKLVIYDESKTELFECATVGSGFMLIKMSVFDRLQQPYFDTDYVDGQFETEDVVFCKKSLMAGVKIYCDPTIEVGHLGTKIY